MRHPWFVRITAALLLIAASHALAREVCKPFEEASELARFFPSTESGVPVTFGMPYSTSTFCSDFSSSMTHTCKHGSDTYTASSSWALSNIGSLTTQTLQVCPNGPDCGSQTSIRFPGTTGTRYETTSASMEPSGDFVACAYAKLDVVGIAGQDQFLAAKWDSAGTGRSFYLSNPSSSSAFTFRIYKDSATSTQITGGTATPGAWHFVCGEYDFVADGSSVMRLSVDGTIVATSNVAVGPPTATSNKVTFGATSDNNNRLKGNIGVMFFSGGINAVDEATMTNALIPFPTGTRGETLSYTRNSQESCTAPNGDISILPVNRPCITCAPDTAGLRTCGLYIQTASSNRTPNSITFESMTLTNLTASANTTAVVAPDGTSNADRLVETVTNGSHTFASNWAIAPSDNIIGVCSVYALAGEITWLYFGLTTKAGTTIPKYFDIANCTAGTNGSATSVTASKVGNWCRVSVAASVSTGATNINCFGTFTSGDGASLTYAGNTSNGMYLWGLQGEPHISNTLPTQLSFTVAGTTNKPAALIQFTKPTGFSTTEGCARIRLTPYWTGTNPTAEVSPVFLHFQGSNAPSLPFYISGGSPSIASNDGTSVPSVNANFTASAARDYRVAWSASRNQFYTQNVTDSLTSSISPFTQLANVGSTFTIGSTANGGSTPVMAIMSNIDIGNSPDGCTR